MRGQDSSRPCESQKDDQLKAAEAKIAELRQQLAAAEQRQGLQPEPDMAVAGEWDLDLQDQGEQEHREGMIKKGPKMQPWDQLSYRTKKTFTRQLSSQMASLAKERNTEPHKIAAHLLQKTTYIN